MTTYEVREQTSTTNPADRGILIRVVTTFAEAQRIRDAAWAAGRVAYISKQAS
jgi:response regulator RpfG family c-di-GMP phosphodiesterase